MLLGGAWDCRKSLSYDTLQDELGLADMAEYVEDLAMNMNVLWRYFFLAGYLKVRPRSRDNDERGSATKSGLK